MKKNTVAPFYTFPADTQKVRCTGYAHGLDCIPLLLFEMLPPGAPMPDGCVTSLPMDASNTAEIEDLASGACEAMLQAPVSPDVQPVTNSRRLFRDSYKQGYKEGYLFGLYVMSSGSLELFYGIPKDRRYELAFRFAWELITGEAAPDPDILMVGVLDQLKALHEQYQAS